MLVTINGKIVGRKVVSKKTPLMSQWFKKWLLAIGGLFGLFFGSAYVSQPDQELIMDWLIILLFCLFIYGVVVAIMAIIAGVKKFLKFKMVIYY